MGSVVITGANRGIGYELARHYRRQGRHVIALCRTMSCELAATGARIIEGIDLGSDGAIQKAASALQDAEIDLLINNAGFRSFESLGEMSASRIEKQITVNAIAPLLLVDALRERLTKGGKIVMISSRVGSIADNARGGEYGYRMSKAALNMAGRNLSIDMRGKGVSVHLVHPGYVQTALTGGEGLVTAREAAEQIASLTARLSLEESGKFFHANGEPLPW